MGAEDDSICEEPGPVLALEPGKADIDGPPPVAALTNKADIVNTL